MDGWGCHCLEQYIFSLHTYCSLVIQYQSWLDRLIKNLSSRPFDYMFQFFQKFRIKITRLSWPDCSELHELWFHLSCFHFVFPRTSYLDLLFQHHFPNPCQKDRKHGHESYSLRVSKGYIILPLLWRIPQHDCYNLSSNTLVLLFGGEWPCRTRGKRWQVT